MKKVAKAILMAVGVISAIGAVMVLGVNLYVQSATTHARIERGLAGGLHAPVKVGSLSFMPWYGLKLSAITTDDAAFDDNTSLKISDISLHFRLWQLMKHNVVIKELTVDGVKVAWTQTPEGKWQVPESYTAPTGFPVETASPGKTPQPNWNPPADPTWTRHTSAPPPPPVTVNHARLRDASFTFYDKNHKPIAALTGVYVQTPYPTDKLVEGTAAIKNVSIQNEFFLELWKGGFKYTPERLSLFDTTCNVDGGTATGALDVNIAEQDSPFVLDTKFSGMDLNKLLTDAGVTLLEATGTISGFVHLEGNLRDSSQAQGKGRITIAGGQIVRSDLLDALGQLLRTDKFQKLSLEDAHADFHVGENKVVLDDLALKSSALTFTSKGVMTADGTALYLLCRLAINADAARQIPGFLLQNFATEAGTGARYVDFPIMGDINHPKSDFLKIVSKHMSAKELWKSITDGVRHETPPPAPVQTPPATPNP